MMRGILREPAGDFILDFSDKVIPTVNESAVLSVGLKEKSFRVECEDCEYDVIRKVSDNIMRIYSGESRCVLMMIGIFRQIKVAVIM